MGVVSFTNPSPYQKSTIIVLYDFNALGVGGWRLGFDENSGS